MAIHRAALLAILVLAGTAGAESWKLDVIYRKKGLPLVGLVTEQGPRLLRMKCVSRKPGAPTIVYPVEVERGEVDHLELLDPAERARLQQRLDNLRQERQVLMERLQALDAGAKAKPESGEVVSLQATTWREDPKKTAWRHESIHFHLVSNARREVVELAAIHLTQIYEAYTRLLPPRASGAPTSILLPSSLEDYQALIQGRGQSLLNPAFYDLARNEVVCLCDLHRLADEVEAARRHHAALQAELAQRESDLRQAYRGHIPPEIRAPLDAARRDMAAAAAHNRTVYQVARRRLFQRLYHEAFHAYLATYVFPADRPQPPRWLNEGLAQIFETALLEAGELRIGHADRERLLAVRAALARDSFLSLADLLRSGSRQFVVAHQGDCRVSDQYYLASWALTFYLTFERKALAIPDLDRYVQALHRGVDPLEAFRDLAGLPLPRLEAAFHDYLSHLRFDGTLGHGE